MAGLMASIDWDATPLGAPSAWPQSLRTAVDMMMASGHAMCLAWGPQRTFLYNQAYAPILGPRHPQALGRPMADVWFDVWNEIEPLVEATFRGDTSTFVDKPLTMSRHGYPEETWWTFSYSPVRDERGDVAGLLNVTLETTARVEAERRHKASEEQLRLLNGELSHRLKNTLSVVQAIASQTLADADPDAVADFGRRLVSLSAAHEVLLQNSWGAAQIGDVAHQVLDTFGADRMTLDGPALDIGPRATLALSLLLHELATNAVKYGALSVTGGQVSLQWQCAGQGDDATVELRWTESGGPPARPPSRRGFGSRIIRMGLTGSGGVDIRYEATGLDVAMTAPLHQLQEA